MYTNPYISISTQQIMVEDNKLRLAVIAGASHALKYREENPRATDRDALKFVAERIAQILREIEED
jgi:predicted alpha/beta-hydrolase family hydrolase